MNKIRLIASDMDGTLFNSRAEISERNAAAILAAQEKGVIFALCTGRLAQFGVLHAENVGITCPVIGANGGALWDDREKRIVSAHQMKADTALQVSEVLNRYEVMYYAFTANNIVSIDAEVNHPNARWNDGAMTQRFGIPFGGGREKMLETVQNEGVIKYFVTRQPDDVYQRISADLAKIEGIYVTASGRNTFEIMRDGVNKNTGVQELAAMHGIPMENVMALGDYDNDMPMIRAAGLGVAMGNASDEVKAAADYVTDTNVNDGVAKAIEKFVL